MKIIFLGTASMQPTKERNLTSMLLTYESENILIDCGEGTQRQLKLANIAPTKITKILISHLHGDHINGLLGLLNNLAVNDYNNTLEIYGPKNTKKLIQLIQSNFIPNILKINVKEIDSGIFFENEKFILEAIKLDHSTTCLGYSFIEKDRRKINLEYTKKFGLTQHPLLGKLQKGQDIEFKEHKIKVKDATILKKGKKITFILDTAYHQNCIQLAKDSDYLIIESTYSEKLKEKASEYKHLTAKQAALIAKKANVKNLILTHFSQRYKNVDELEKEAKKEFKDVILAKDFLQIDL